MNDMKKILLLLLLLVIVVAGYMTWDSTPPRLVMETPPEAGAGSTIVLVAEDQGRGIESVRVTLKQGEFTRVLREEINPTIYLPWEENRKLVLMELKPEDWMDRDRLSEGPFELEVSATDSGDYGFFSDTTSVSLSMNLDMTPPGIEVLSAQHNIRRGGAEAVRYRIKGGGLRSGAIVGGNEFEGYPTENGGEGVYATLFVWAYDQPTDTPIKLWAEDSVGNRTEIVLPCHKIERNFRQRSINVSEGFIDRVIPEIIRLSPDVQAQEDKLGAYLSVNQGLRIKNNQKLAEITFPVSEGIQWNEPFLQMRNSKVEALFADHRSYYYNGNKVDEQTHLGYDLASTAQSPIEAANNGRVVFVDNLGIYGNCVVLDHGLGLYSLYAHMSSMDVHPDSTVTRGEIIGRSGQTGLAGGDHLHYSMLVQGIHTNPLEWWDPSWIRLHVLNRGLSGSHEIVSGTE